LDAEPVTGVVSWKFLGLMVAEDEDGVLRGRLAL
jgi:hypothetical protein